MKMSRVLKKEILSYWMVVVAALAITLDMRCDGQPQNTSVAANVPGADYGWRYVELTYSKSGKRSKQTDDVVSFLRTSLKELSGKEHGKASTAQEIEDVLKGLDTHNYNPDNFQNVKNWECVATNLDHGKHLFRKSGETKAGDQILVLMAYKNEEKQVIAKALWIVDGIMSWMKEEEDVTIFSGKLEQTKFADDLNEDVEAVQVAVYVNQAHTRLADINMETEEITSLSAGVTNRVLFKDVQKTTTAYIRDPMRSVINQLKNEYQIRNGMFKIHVLAATATYAEKTKEPIELIGLFHDVVAFVFRAMTDVVMSSWGKLPLMHHHKPTTLWFHDNAFELKISGVGEEGGGLGFPELR